MAPFKAEQEAAEQLIKSDFLSLVVGKEKLKRYDDLLANVRHDNKYHSIRSLVQPNDSEVREIARVLVQASDFIDAAQEFVDSFTTYRPQVGDYWEIPGEVLADEAGDCDGKAILLCSILRNYMPPDQGYCAFGLWSLDGEIGGHMWGVVEDKGGEDRTLEATASPGKPTRGKYIIYGIFNDYYTFATDSGLREFDLKPVTTPHDQSQGLQCGVFLA